jgi:hypothetical protein
MDSSFEKSPLYLKAREIQKLVDSIVDVIYESDLEYETQVEGEIIDENINFMIENSMLIPANIAGAFPEDLPYDLKMENATLIRKAARELLTDATSIESFGFKNIEYLDLLRKEIDEFRLLFAEWVKTFDPWNYMIDRWGLFNPPGVNFDDHDPNDDLPFNSSEEEDFSDDWDDEIDDDIHGEGDEDDD